VFDPPAADCDRPFRAKWASTSTELYLRQRSLLGRAARGELEELEGEEEVIGVVEAVIAGAYRRISPRKLTRSSTSTRHRDLADATRAELLRTMHVNHSLREIAASVGASPYHLCRAFRSFTGRTLHQHRLELRLRLALELLEHATTAANLSAVAHDLGFSSHSHFVRAMRHHAGLTPSAVRALLQ
jgi:AraC-like DNA-binding protein